MDRIEERSAVMNLTLINPKERRQLFLDDYAVEKMIGIKRSLHPPKKCGPVIRPDRSRGEASIQSRSCPQWNSEKGIWEWWYGGTNSYYATSKDGENWESSPVKERHRHVIRDEVDEDPHRRYKALGGNGRSDALYLWVSPDGFNWTMLDVPPVPSQDESQFTYDPFTGQFIAMVKHGTKWGRSVFLATSKDFVHFTEPKLIFHSDEIDWENRRRRVREVIENPAYITPPIVDDEDYIAEVYNMAVMPYEGVYIGFPVIFNPFGAHPPPQMNFSRINQVELTVSRDLYHWERMADRALFLGIEPWDGVNYGTSQLLLAGQPVVRDKGEIWVYYNALRMPGGIEEYKTHNRNKELFRLDVDPELFNDSGALSLAKLRPDGFVSLDADEAGTITTKPFIMKGEDLYVNAEARWGELYAEILDAETMEVFPGFWVPAEQPAPLTGDHVRAKINWKYPHDLVFEKPVRIRFYMHQARLYSFWLE